MKVLKLEMKQTELMNMKNKINRKNMVYYSSKELFDFNAFKTMKSFGEKILQ